MSLTYSLAKSFYIIKEILKPVYVKNIFAAAYQIRKAPCFFKFYFSLL